MDNFVIGLYIIAIAYGILLFFDSLFKSCAHYPYIKLLDNLGLKIGLCTLSWKTKAFNRLLIKWGNSRPRLLKLWFSTGVHVSLVFLVLSLFFLIYTLFPTTLNKENKYSVTIEAVIPGVNLPFSELGYYVATLLVCSAVHELGHALAAALEDVNLVDVGCRIFFILPVAYVTITIEKINMTNYRKILNVFCAGVWHNICLSMFSFLIYISLPMLFLPLYVTGNGITVVELRHNSPLRVEYKGLRSNDVINRINDCDVLDDHTWYSCLTSQFHKPAFCIESDLVLTYDESVPLKHFHSDYVECCDSKNDKNLCFEFLDKANSVLELPGHACLPGRLVIEKATYFCNAGTNQCPEGLYCFRPILANNTNLFKIQCRNKNVIYIGHVSDIYNTIKVSPFISKLGQSTHLADVITKFLKYVTIISLGLAFINIFPILFMDGEHIAKILGMVLLQEKFGIAVSRMIISIITWSFTIFLTLYLLISTLRSL